MAVGTYTYGSVAGVQAIIGYMVDSRTFTTDTSPTLAEVETFLDAIAAEIHMHMVAVGYPVDAAADVATDAPKASGFLVQLNNLGAAAKTLESHPYEADPDSESRPALMKRYQEMLKLIAGRTLEKLGLTLSADMSAMLLSGSYQTADGDDKKPLFSRDMYDYPESRSLTE